MALKEELSYLFDEIYKLTDTLYETMNFNDITYDLEENYKKVIELCCNTYY